MQKIVPNIWCNGSAREAAEFYVSAFRGASIVSEVKYPTEGLPDFQKHMAGQDLTLDVEIEDFRITLINADDHYQPNPALSFLVNFDPSRIDDAETYLREVHAKLLIDGGFELMPLNEYPFSPLYSWVQDRFGVSWQLMLTNPEGEPRPFVCPDLLFGHTNQNKAGEALEYYLSVFEDSELGNRVDYMEQAGPAAKGAVMFADMRVADQYLVFMDSGAEQDFTFTGGISLMVNCEDQAEIDHLWDKLADQEQPCGWCVDKFGVVWQIIPKNFDELMSRPNAYENMMGMKKIEISGF